MYLQALTNVAVVCGTYRFCSRYEENDPPPEIDPFYQQSHRIYLTAQSNKLRNRFLHEKILSLPSTAN